MAYLCTTFIGKVRYLTPIRDKRAEQLVNERKLERILTASHPPVNSTEYFPMLMRAYDLIVYVKTSGREQDTTRYRAERSENLEQDQRWPPGNDGKSCWEIFRKFN